MKLQTSTMISAPECLLCPLRGCLMEDPIFILSTGQTVSQKSFVQWRADGNTTCPVSGVELHSFEYKPNHALKSCVEWWKTTIDEVSKCEIFSEDGAFMPESSQKNSKLGEELLSAATLGDLRDVQKLLRMIDFEPRGPIGESPLHNAALWGHLRIVQELLSVVLLDSSIDAQDDEGRTPLWCAAFMGHVDICQQLLIAGADMDLTSYLGNTPLQCAISRGNVEVVEALHAAGADI